ncbi:hypothetical protein HanIR_Chr02g0083851 [Helianthus annuus]|nr:hypothetical protein HanIR_Chr02g0083851 [Helianthus annuus]
MLRARFWPMTARPARPMRERVAASMLLRVLVRVFVGFWSVEIEMKVGDGVYKMGLMGLVSGDGLVDEVKRWLAV